MEVAGGSAYYRTVADRAVLPRRPWRQVPPVHAGADAAPRRPGRPRAAGRRHLIPPWRFSGVSIAIFAAPETQFVDAARPRVAPGLVRDGWL